VKDEGESPETLASEDDEEEVEDEVEQRVVNGEFGKFRDENRES
jgi:hypothetical protein